MDLRHILQKKDALVSTEARFARPVDIPNGAGVRGSEHGIESLASLSPDQNHECPIPVQAKIGPRGRICTCTVEGLSFVPLRWATRGWLAEPKLRRRLVPTAGFAPTLCAF